MIQSKLEAKTESRQAHLTKQLKKSYISTQSTNPVCLDNQTQRSPPRITENPQKRTFQAGRVSSFFLSVQLLLTVENGPIKVGGKKGLFLLTISGFSWDPSVQAHLSTHVLFGEGGISAHKSKALPAMDSHRASCHTGPSCLRPVFLNLGLDLSFCLILRLGDFQMART